MMMMMMMMMMILSQVRNDRPWVDQNYGPIFRRLWFNVVTSHIASETLQFAMLFLPRDTTHNADEIACRLTVRPSVRP